MSTWNSSNYLMELFVKILEQIIESQEIVKRNKDLEQIIHMLRVYTKTIRFLCAKVELVSFMILF